MHTTPGRNKRKLAPKKLYEDHYLTDRLPEDGLAAVFYHNISRAIDVMA
jgi:hypothetical protein